MSTTTDQAQATMEIQTDGDGNWEVQVPQALSPGMHKVMVETENGEQQDVALFNMPIRTEVIDNTTGTDYGQYIYPLALLVVLVLVLAANSLRLMVKAKKTKKELANKQKFTAFFTVFAALLAVAIFVYVAYQSGWLNNRATNDNLDQTSNLSNDKQNDSEPIKYVGVSGLVIDPLSDIGVSDVDLSAYDISIRTQEGGAYNFASIPSDGYIKITHPDLKKALQKSLIIDDQGQMDIIFNVSMLNNLIEFVDGEASGQLLSIYNQMPKNIKEKQSVDNFIANFQPSFSTEDLSQQSIIITKQTKQDAWASAEYDVLFDRVVQTDLMVHGSAVSYYAIMEDGTWKIFK